VDIPKDSPGLRILQAVRDEAHRFAVTYHRNLRDSTAMASVLDEIPGVGPARRKALLRAFETVDTMRKATAEELAEKAGIPRSVARVVREQLAAGGV
jgi:excinuclease ABC subunit C